MAMTLLRESGAIGKRIRLLGITLSNLNNQAETGGEVQMVLPFGNDFEF